LHLVSFLTALQNTPLAVAIQSGDWLFPGIETVHVMALAIVYGSIVVVDLRLLGFAGRSRRVSEVAAECLPYTWTAFVVAAIAGSALFISKAERYFGNTQFEFKFLCIALAGINMLVFHRGIYRRVLEWDYTRPPPLSARLAGGISLGLWTAVVFLGRWVGFTV
jgi:hypothetical protein